MSVVEFWHLASGGSSDRLEWEQTVEHETSPYRSWPDELVVAARAAGLEGFEGIGVVVDVDASGRPVVSHVGAVAVIPARVVAT